MNFITILTLVALAVIVDGQKEVKNHDKEVHIALLSDRIKPSVMVMSSVCSSTGLSNESLFFHLVSEDSKMGEMEKAANGVEACDGAKVSIMSISEVTQQLVQQGFDPFWASFWASQIGLTNTQGWGGDKPVDKTEWGVVTPYNHGKHAAPLNILRFYLPHLPEFDDVDNLVFLDDDIVVHMDISNLVSLPRHPDTALITGCQHWQWKSGALENQYNLSVRDSNYIGNVGNICTDDDKINPDANCVSSTLEQDIADISMAIEEGNTHSFFASRPLDRQSWNMGFNVIDTKAWISMDITKRFEKIVNLNFANKIFPSDTLAFGLVLGYFAVGDSFECYDAKITHVTGLAFIPQDDLDVAGFTVEMLQNEGLALHYNGPQKPWDLDYKHLCADPSARLEVASDIWLRRCIDLNVCVCDVVEQEPLQKSQDDTSTDIKYTRTLRKKKSKSSKNAKNEYIFVSK